MPPPRAEAPHLRAMPGSAEAATEGSSRPAASPRDGAHRRRSLLRAGRAAPRRRCDPAAARRPERGWARGEGMRWGRKTKRPPRKRSRLRQPGAGGEAGRPLRGREAPHLLPCGRAARPPSRSSRAPPRTHERARTTHPPPTRQAPPRQQREPPTARTTRCRRAGGAGAGGEAPSAALPLRPRLRPAGGAPDWRCGRCGAPWGRAGHVGRGRGRGGLSLRPPGPSRPRGSRSVVSLRRRAGGPAGGGGGLAPPLRQLLLQQDTASPPPPRHPTACRHHASPPCPAGPPLGPAPRPGPVAVAPARSPASCPPCSPSTSHPLPEVKHPEKMESVSPGCPQTSIAHCKAHQR